MVSGDQPSSQWDAQSDDMVMAIYFITLSFIIITPKGFG